MLVNSVLTAGLKFGMFVSAPPKQFTHCDMSFSMSSSFCMCVDTSCMLKSASEEQPGLPPCFRPCRNMHSDVESPNTARSCEISSTTCRFMWFGSCTVLLQKMTSSTGAMYDCWCLSMPPLSRCASMRATLRRGVRVRASPGLELGTRWWNAKSSRYRFCTLPSMSHFQDEGGM